MESSSYDIATAEYLLQSGTSSLDERVIALRLVKARVDSCDAFDASGGAEGESLDSYNRKRLKQLLLDSILKIILSEDHTASFRKRQMVRTELLLLLSGVLNSNSLFGTILSDPGTLQRKMIELSRQQVKGTGEGFNLDDDSIVSLQSAASNDTLVDDDSLPDSLSEATLPLQQRRHRQRVAPPVLQPPGGFRVRHSSSESTLLHSSSATAAADGEDQPRVAMSASLKSAIERRKPPLIPPEVQILRPLIVKHAKLRPRQKFLKPRPSVLHNDRVLTDSFVPGADPLNYFEQDRKLGYQKPRMWFPGVEATAKPTLLPTAAAIAAGNGSADDVVREFLQMRALASYLGDLVEPFQPNAAASIVSTANTDTATNAHKQRRGAASAISAAVQLKHPLTSALQSSLSGRLQLPQQQQQQQQQIIGRGSSSHNKKNALKSALGRFSELQQQHQSQKGTSIAAVSVSSLVNDGINGSEQRSSRLSGFTDLRRFNAALREVAAVWSPLLGLHLPMKQLHQRFQHGLNYSRQLLQQQQQQQNLSPQQEKKLRGLLAYSSALLPQRHNQRGAVRGNPDVVLGVKRLFSRSTEADVHSELMPFKSLQLLTSTAEAAADGDEYNNVPTTPSSQQQPQTLSKKRRRMHSSTAELRLPSAGQQSPLKSPMHSLSAVAVASVSSNSGNNDSGDMHGVMLQYQREVDDFLQLQKRNVTASLRATEAMIAGTINSQYQLLLPGYIVLLEGSKADARRLLARALLIFSRVRRRNLLLLALGVWKISLAVAASVQRQPQYARVAACFLMARWLQEVHLKKLRVWLTRWRRRAGVLIFSERCYHAVVIQTLYRRWRDRRRFVAMHRAGPWRGVLSDVFLAPKRENVDYFVPDVIRTERRLLWLAATMIQTLYRCWIESREYFLKRRQLVLLQSIARMFPKHRKYRRLRRTTVRCQALARRTVKWKQFRRMKRAAVVVQKYTRRLLSQSLKQSLLQDIWHGIERRLAAVIRLQCRWRIHRSKCRLQHRRLTVQMRIYAALVIQRNYYRYRRAFHTFFLMCALRQRGEEDVQLQRLATAMGKYKAARVIQRLYKERYFRRNISSIVKVQCWFRGRLGYNLVDMLRRERWAERKLRHWGRVRVQRLHRCARRIQRCWLYAQQLQQQQQQLLLQQQLRRQSLQQRQQSQQQLQQRQPNRMLRHLWWRARLRDEAASRSRSEQHYHAAGRIQAAVKGAWDRRWVRRFRAALLIQRNARFFFALKRWRRMKREYIRNGVKKFVGKFLTSAVQQRASFLAALHSLQLRKPQALLRGALVRCAMRRARDCCYRIGLAAVRIQRFWRRSGAVAAAVEEVLALKRAKSNPFLRCCCLHELLLLVQRECRAYYSTADPRVGLKVSSLLHRLGCSELLEIFPRKNFVYAADLQSLTASKLADMFNLWKSRLSRTKSATNNGDNNSSNDGKDSNAAAAQMKKSRTLPLQQFELILDVVRPPIQVRHSTSDAAKISLLSHLPESQSPQQAATAVRKAYLKRFGKHLNARAEHLARDVLQLAWSDYNNFRCVGSSRVLTRGQLLRAVQTASESTAVLQRLRELRQPLLPAATAAEEQRWDAERVEAAARIMQLAMDSALLLLPAGSLRDDFEKALYRVTSYRRKISFLKSKFSRTAAKAAADSNGKHANVTEITAAKAVLVASSSDDSDDNDNRSSGALALLSSERAHALLRASDSLDCQFSGNSTIELDLELNISICKVYSEVLNRAYIGSMGVQSLKNKWSNDALKRAVAAEKMSSFLSTATQQYQQYVSDDKVKKVWQRFRRAERSKQRLRLLLEAAKRRRAQVQHALSLVPRFGCECYEDDYGYPYWVDYYPGRIALLANKTAAATAAAAAVAEGSTFGDDISTIAESLAATTGGVLEEANERASSQQYVSSYEMPQYSIQQWRQLLKLQRIARVYIVGARDRRLQREEAQRLEIARQQAILAEERRRGRLHVSATLSVRGVPLQLTTISSAGATTTSAASATAAAIASSAVRKSTAAAAVSTAVPKTSTTVSVALKKKSKRLDFADTVPSKESLLPWKFRFEKNPHFKSGDWALLRTFPEPATAASTAAVAVAGAGRGSLQQLHSAEMKRGRDTDFDLSVSALQQWPQYQVVVVFRLRDNEDGSNNNNNGGYCDVRSVKGVRMRGISVRRLCQMNIAPGSRVEVRYKQQQVFYRATVIRVDATAATAATSDSQQQYQYAVRFDDGEVATALCRDAIRPSAATLAEFLRGRSSAVLQVHQQHKRLLHFEQLRRARVKRDSESAVNTYNNSRAQQQQQQQQQLGFFPRSPAAATADENDDFSEITGLLEAPPVFSAAAAAEVAESADAVLAIEDAPLSARSFGHHQQQQQQQQQQQMSTSLVAVVAKEAAVLTPRLTPRRQHANITTATTNSAAATTTTNSVVAVATNSVVAVATTATTAASRKPPVLFRTQLTVRLMYTKTPLLFGWKEYTERSNSSSSNRRSRNSSNHNNRSSSSSSSDNVYYVHAASGAVSDDIPTYEAQQVHAAMRIQQQWRLHCARIALRQRANTFNPFDIIAAVVKRCSHIAFVGFELEGVTPLQMLCRAGFWEVAAAVEAHCKATKQPPLAALTIEDVANKPREQADSIGLSQPVHIKELREFQTWWHKSTVAEKQKRLSLCNYYSDPYTDKRSLQQCIADSEPLLVQKFSRVVKTSATRTRNACRAMLLESQFPHSHLQIDNYLRKYGDKPELARDCIFELVNKHTVHSYQEERQVLRQYLQACQLLSGIMGSLKMRVVKQTIASTVRKAKEICSSVSDDHSRQLVSGPEAKAAWLIRRDVLLYISNMVQAAVIAQRNVRCYLLSKRWKLHLAARIHATDVLQRCIRRFLAYRTAAVLRGQQQSDWEQLWDARRNLLYYYNCSSGGSQYDEPPGYFRPLVRDPVTAMLLQAWPDLQREGSAATAVGAGAAPSARYTALVGLSTHALCGICQLRKCERICKQCVDEANNDPQKNYAFPYCFACFMKEHSEEHPWKMQHDFQQVVTSEDAVSMLRCSLCDAAAVRKCEGMLDDAQVDDILSELSACRPQLWMNVLQAANIGGQRKLEMILEQSQLDDVVQIASTPAQLQQQQQQQQQLQEVKLSAAQLSVRLELLRAQLERMRAECDECYCASCYCQVHAGGKRAAHRWKGFNAGAAVCSVCSNSPAESNCIDCDNSAYCSSCFKVFHGMGRKRKHKKTKILELLSEDQQFCHCCQRRAGTVFCESDRCNAVSCDSCYEFKHKPRCQRDDVMKSNRKSQKSSEVIGESHISPTKQHPQLEQSQQQQQPKEIMEGGCVVCGEVADQKCVQCGDLYCSRTWMGNPGCFLAHHSKGNRASHSTERYFYRKPLTASRRKEMQLAREEDSKARFQPTASRTMP